MSNHYFFLIFFLLIFKVNSLLPPEKRKELWNKYLKKVTPDTFEALEYPFNSDYLEETTFAYDVNQVNEILNQYGFPQNFNFLEEHDITPNVKNQESCGCCWSHAATSSLAYRYKLKGLDLDLSPQDGLSCYLRDCESGNYLISPQFNLIKNGTLTEGCLPFVSGDGKTIPECPTTCEDGSEFKRYYSQNAYLTQGSITQKNYYEYIALIIDILINKGPVVSAISVYKDFDILCDDQQKCHEEVYTYDGTSEYKGGHAITMVGYGFMNNKFYWLIQNSWGESSCDKGFVKIEFGQVGVESIAFSEPYIEEETTPVDIPMTINEIGPGCDLDIEVEDEYLDKWKNSIEIQYKSEKGKYFYYQCSAKSSNILDNKFNCYFDYWNYKNLKGYYNFDSFASLGKDNTFTLDISEITQITYFGNEILFPLFENTQYFYVSEKGSKFIFPYNPNNEVEESSPYLYPHSPPYYYLTNCKRQKYFNETTGYYFIVCELTEEEVSYYSTNSGIDLVYNYLCNYYVETGAVAYKLDINKYPIFRVKSASLEKTETVDYNTIISLITTIDGTLRDNMDAQTFFGLAHIEYKN